MNRKLLIIALLLSLSPTVVADEPETSNDRKVVYKERTEIDFEGVEVQGQLVKPQGTLILDRRSAHFNPLIKLRTDFDDEIDSSVNEIK
tara:strand:+ start:155 stop:421 length:267 start_codon:yes stop_codon:yes gene_type:complete